jgi:predicted ATP-dependent endonuclease of OLD family
MSIEKVIIKNYRGLRDAEIKFGDGANIIVGNNETGKSTLLEAINLALRCQINRRPAAYELHPFMFNRAAVAEFIQSHKDRNPQPPPSILIELYFKESPAVAELKGMNNSLADDQAYGISFEIKLDEENFAEEYAAYVSDVDGLNELPIEYYKIEWRSFAWGPTLTPQAVPIKAVLIDPSAISNTYAANKYVVEILRDHLTKAERVHLDLSYRGMRETFQSDPRIKAVNATLATQVGSVTDKTLSVALDVTTRASWETGVLPHLDDIPLTLAGKGEQNSIKIKLAMAAAEGCELLLMEEPENHLSHGNLGKLIHHVSSNSGGKQLIVTTHSSYVLNKLGIDSVIMFDGVKGITLDDLPPTTKSYFERLPGHDTLRVMLARKSILVEGPSDELIVQKAYLQTHGKLPLQDGLEVVSVGTSFKRFLDIASRLDLAVSIIRDNDSESAAKIALFDEYAGKENIQICIDTDDATPTLEPQLIKANGLAKLNLMLGKVFENVGDLLVHMTANKTDTALTLFEHTDELNIPEYIQNAVT